MPKSEYGKFYTGDSYVILSVSVQVWRFLLFIRRYVGYIVDYFEPIDERNQRSFVL